MSFARVYVIYLSALEDLINYAFTKRSKYILSSVYDADRKYTKMS